MTTRLTGAFLAPCIGTGGADAQMAGLLACCDSIDWRGVAVLRSGETSQQQVEWFRRCGVTTPVHLWHAPDEMGPLPKGVIAHPDRRATAVAACLGVDVIISWCVPDGASIYPRLAPSLIVEYAQNQDQMAAEVARQNAPFAHALAACSEAASLAFAPADRGEVSVLYNGVDPRRIVEKHGREAIRRGLGITPDQKVLLFLGRFAPEKNPAALWQALTKLPDEWIGVYVGRGPERERLEYVGQTLMPGRLRFIDYCHHVGDLYAAADVFLLASDFEGDSLAIHEASATGLPVVCTPVGSVPEFEARFGAMTARVEATADECGRVVRPTPHALAAAVLRADSQPFRQGEAALAAAVRSEHFLWPRIAGQWEEYLHSLVFAARTRQRWPTARRIMGATPATRPA